jgi:hypothetical protein
MGVSQTICSGWPRAMLVTISTSQLARITGVSHQCLPCILSTLFIAVCSRLILCVPCSVSSKSWLNGWMNCLVIRSSDWLWWISRQRFLSPLFLEFLSSWRAP